MPYVTTNGIRMYYEEEGKGDPLLLIMGITAPGSVWEKHVVSWKKKFRCIMPDNRGVGLSDVPRGPYTSRQMADDHAGLLDALQVEKVRVVGCSMGSIIAQQLAIHHSHKISSCVFMCPWAKCDAKARAIFTNMISCKEKLTAEEFSLYIQLLIFSKSYWDNPENVDALRQARVEASQAFNPQSLQGLQSQAMACITHNVIDDLHKVKQPSLVIGGHEDIFTPPWMANELANNLPNAHLHLYERYGHAFHWEALDDFNHRIISWLLDY